MKRIIIIIICFASCIIYACKHELIIATAVPTNLVYLPTNSTIVSGTSGSSVVPTLDSGGSNCSYAITSTAIAGISIKPNTGVISWTSSVVIGTYNIIVTASNNAGSASTTYSLIVNSALTKPSGLNYSPASSTIVKGSAGSSAVPTINTGGSTITYSLTGTIATGISINSSNGVISWSSAVAVGIYPITVTATNNLGNTTGTYTLTVTNTATVTAPSSFSYNPASSSVTVGTAGSSVIPTINSGLGTITYSLTGTIPSGVSISSSTGTISWSTAVAAATYNFTVTATNSAGNTTTSYSLTVTTATVVSFSTSILPVIKSSCSGCHSYASSYTGITGHSTGCNSIQNKIGTTYCSGSRMPQGSTPLSASFIALFNSWITQGQLNN